MDSDNQIDAKISQDAMVAFRPETSNAQSMGRSPEKHEIELLDFKLVFMYSTSTPNLSLEVNSFRIDWEKGIQKFTPSKKLKKNKHVKVLLDRAFQRVKSSQIAIQSTGTRTSLPQSSGSDIPHDGQRGHTQNNALEGVASQQLSSQMNANDSARLGRTSRPANVGLPASTELLRRLASSAKAPSRNNSLHLSPPREHAGASVNEGVLQVLINGNADSNSPSCPVPPAPAVNDSHQEPYLRRSHDREASVYSATGASQTEREMEPQSQDHEPASKLQFHTDAEMFSTQKPLEAPENAIPSGNHSPLNSVEPNDEIRRGSKKRQRESVKPQPESPENGSNSYTTEFSPSKKRRTELSQTRSTEHKRIETLNNANAQPDLHRGQKSNANSGVDQALQAMRTDPWKGLSSISASEVTVPPDQAELLDSRLCWIPPVPGDPVPQGHVPPTLLKQWNIIATRRHRLAEETNATEERSPSPTQDTMMSSLSDNESEGSHISWERSPERPHPRTRNVLPPSSSPVKQSPSTRRELIPDRNEGAPGDVEAENATKVSSDSRQMSGLKITEPSAAQRTSEGLATEATPSQKQPDTEANNTIRLSQNSVSGAAHRDGDVQMRGQPAVSESQAPASDQSSLAARFLIHQETHDNLGHNEDDSGDDSDESMMEASVPLGFGENWSEPTQSTQAEQDLTSSGPSLPPGTAGTQVQVAVTPVMNNSRRSCSKPKNDQTEIEPSQSAISSSQANKVSSQSQILDTYPHHGSCEKSQSSNEGPNPSSLRSENGSVRVDVVGTQTQNSGSTELSQVGTQSQEIVLDSSGPAQRHQDIPLGSHSAIKRSGVPFASPIAPTRSQLDEPTQGSVRDNLSQDAPASSPQVSPIRHPGTAVPDREQDQDSHHSTPKNNEEETISQAWLNTQSTPPVACRGNHIDNKDKYAEANEAYKTFCNHYPVYTGDFNHFTELCFKLQTVRAQGKLQRSFLWDDFIIMHLLKYPSHIKERVSQGSGILSYEDYFCLNITHAFHKKGCLTAQGLDQAASQFAGEDEPPAATSRAPSKLHATPRESANQSFTTSLINGFSNLHTHSVVNEVPQSSLPESTEPATMPVPWLTPVRIKEEGDKDDQDFAAIANVPDSIANVPDDSMDTEEVKEEKPALSSMESIINQTTRISQHAASTEDNRDIKMEEIEETDFEDNADLDDDGHETASVELGDDLPDSHSKYGSLRLLGEEYDTRPEKEENWFVSLRHMRPTDPVWSDDPNTPFKRFVEADMNVLSERRRRGGSKVLLDEKGVIRRLIHR